MLLVAFCALALLLSQGGFIRGLYIREDEIDFKSILGNGVLWLLCLIAFVTGRLKTATNSSSRSAPLLFCVFVCLLVPTVVNGYFHYGQSLDTGPREVFFHGGLLCFFVLASILGRAQPHFVTHLFLALAAYCALIVLLRWLAPGIAASVFDDQAFARHGERLDRQRTLLPQGLRDCLYFAYYYLVASFVLNRRETGRALISLGLALGIAAIVLFMLMDRRKLAGMLLLTMPLLLFAVRYTRKKALVVLAAGAVLTTILTVGYMDAISDQIHRLYELSVNELSDQRGAAGIRIPCAEFYLSEYMKTGFIGIGAISRTRVTRHTGILDALEKDHYNHVDIGLVGTLALWGVQGVLVTLLLWYGSLRDFWLCRRSPDLAIRICALAGTLFLVHEMITQSQFFWNIKNAFFWGVFFYQSFALANLHRSQIAVPAPVSRTPFRSPGLGAVSQ
jgi:hypothetical protein